MTNPAGQCRQCGAALKPGVRFCEACGAAVAAAPPTPPGPPVPPAPPAPLIPAPVLDAPRRRSAVMVVGAICVVLVVASLAVALVWKTTNHTTPLAVKPQRKTTGVPAAPPAPKPNGGAAYLPAPGLRLTYHEQYVDGDEGDWELVTAQVSDRIALSSAECLNSYATAGADDIAIMHYQVDADGIWKVLDIRPADRELFLPLSITPGTVFASTGVKGKVIAVGKTCNLGFTTFTDCLVIQRDYSEVGYVETQYFAPGYGIVQTKTGGTTMRKLTAITRMNATEATAFVKKYTTWQKALVD